MDLLGPAHATAAAIGALHGLEPGHGWPVGAVYAVGRPRPWLAAAGAGVIIGAAHLLSSFAVVAAFQLLDAWLEFTRMAWMEPVAGLLLVIVGIVEWWRGGHAHGGGDGKDARSRADRGLWGIAGFAFVLGFAHEEEVAILGLCAGRASCWSVMAVYTLVVAGFILALTVAATVALGALRNRLHHWEHRLSRISAALLIGMGLLYAAGVL